MLNLHSQIWLYQNSPIFSKTTKINVTNLPLNIKQANSILFWYCHKILFCKKGFYNYALKDPGHKDVPIG